MNRFFVKMILIFMLLLSGISMAYAEETNMPARSEGRMKPPPEAITACKGKAEGTQVQFTTPRGDTLTGVCKTVNGVLAAMPARGSRPPQGGPPSGDTGGQAGGDTGTPPTE